METGDIYKDIDVVRDESLIWSFALTPLDLTGCTAVLVADAPLGALTMTVSATFAGAVPFGILSLSVLDTSAWVAGIYAYRVLITFADASVRRFGHGRIRVS